MDIKRTVLFTLATAQSLNAQGSIREAYFSKKGGKTYNWQGLDDYGYDALGFDEYGYDVYGKPMYDQYAGLQPKKDIDAVGHDIDNKYETEHGDDDDDDDDDQKDGEYVNENNGVKVPWWHKPFPSGTDRGDPGWWDWYWEEASMTDAAPTANIFFTDYFDFKFPIDKHIPTIMTRTETTTKIHPTVYITTTGGSRMTITIPATEVYSCGKAAYCEEYYTECYDGVPLCMAGRCEYGYYNSLSLPASECIDTELCIAGTQSVAISGDGCWVVQGVPSNISEHVVNDSDWRGQAAVWHREGITWQKYQFLIPSDGVLADWYGISVDICHDGSTIVVGSWLDSENGVRSGSAYVFAWEPDRKYYRQEAKLLPSDGQAFDYFGQAVRISHDCTTIVVGAFGNDEHGALSGAVYVYLVEEINPQPASPSPSPNFSNKIYIDPSQIKKDKQKKCDESGTEPEATHRWIEVQKITLGGDASPMDMFGQSLAINGDGTKIFTSGRNLESVLYYEFSLGVMKWVLRQEIKPNQRGMIAFGHSIDTDISGTTLAVGAPWGSDITKNGADEGLVYVYGLDLTVSTNFQLFPFMPLTSPNSAEDNFFGFSVALNGHNGSFLLVGEPGFDYFASNTVTNGSTSIENVGAAYIFSNWCGFWEYYGLMFNATVTDDGTTTSSMNYFFGVSVDMDDCATDIVIADSYNKDDVFVWVPYFTPILHVITVSAADTTFPVSDVTVIVIGPEQVVNKTGPQHPTETWIGITDENGTISFGIDEILKPGDYNIAVIPRSDYFDSQENITLHYNTETTITFQLGINPQLQVNVYDYLTSTGIDNALVKLYDSSGTLVDSGFTIDGTLSYLGPVDPGFYGINVTASGYNYSYVSDINMTVESVIYVQNVSLISLTTDYIFTVESSNGTLLPDATVTLVISDGITSVGITGTTGEVEFIDQMIGEYTAIAKFSNFAESTITGTAMGTENVTGVFTLADTNLDVTVVNTLSVPIEDAVVYATNEVGVTLSGTTLANGCVIFYDFLPGNFSLLVVKDEFISAIFVGIAVLGVSNEITVTIESDHATLVVEVLNELGVGINGTNVTVTQSNGSIVVGTTDVAGESIFRDTDPGSYTLVVTDPSGVYLPDSSNGTIILGTTTTANITLLTILTKIIVNVADSTSASIDNDTFVELTDVNGSTNTTTVDGIAIFSDVPAGVISLEISSLGYYTTSQTEVASGGILLIPVSLLSSRGTIIFNVTDENGSPLENVAAIITTLEGTISPVKITDAFGLVNYTEQVSGLFDYSIELIGYKSQTGSFTLPGGLAITTAITMALADANAQVAVEDSSNSPIVGATVNVTQANGTVVTGITDLIGEYTFMAIDPGIFTAVATATGYQPGNSMGTAVPAVTTPVKITLISIASPATEK
eukprot:CFRG6940T1